MSDIILPGFYYFRDIFNAETAKVVTKFLNSQEWKSISLSHSGRKVQQYGFEYDYYTRKDSYNKIEDIPDNLLILQQLALEVVKIHCPDKTCLFNQCIVNKYEPGQGISAHIDKETFGPVIACFTLGSGTTITFTNEKEKKIIEKYVEPNSLYIMSEDSRHTWKHEIKARLKDNGIRRNTRISVTFRSVTE